MKVGDTVICNNPRVVADYKKNGTIRRGPFTVELLGTIYCNIPIENWYDILVEGDSIGTAYHESELLLAKVDA